MNGLLDLEEIKSYMLMGDVKSSVKWLEKRKTKSKFMFMATKKDRYVVMGEFLNIIEDTIKGRKTIAEAEKEMSSDRFSELVYMVDDRNDLISTFIYYLRYSMDRYNVEYPRFDQKRCDDL
jgi:RNA processing factor Prp31